jgi:hypothetical protein
MKHIILSAGILSFLLIGLLSAQEATPPSEVFSAHRGQPRPTPPSCCRPFRSVDNLALSNSGIIGSIIGGGSVPTNIPTNTTSTATSSSIRVFLVDNIEQYRLSLEEYRKQAEVLRLTNKISKADYIIMIQAYKDGFESYLKEFKERN